MARVFLDTNIIVYAADDRERDKRDRARTLIASLRSKAQGVVSTQVLCETYSIVTKKLGAPPLEAKTILRKLGELEVVILGPELIQKAIDCSILNQLSFWDALIVAAAASANCDTLWTEDLNHGQVIMGVRVENPLEAGDTR